MYTLEVQTGKKKLSAKLKEPDFEIYGLAQAEGMMPNGKFNEVAAGKLVFDICAQEGDIEEIKKDTKTYVSAAWKAYDLINIYATELKKN